MKPWSKASVGEGLVGLVLSVACVGIASAAGDIHKVDFQNYTYVSACLEKDVRVVGGQFVETDEDGQESILSISDVNYGDLDGDGADEAVVRTFCAPGRASQVFVYSMRGGGPVLAATLGPGYGAMGGFRRVAITGGKLVVETLWTDDGSTANPKAVETTTYRLGKDGQFVEVGETQRRPYSE